MRWMETIVLQIFTIEKKKFIYLIIIVVHLVRYMIKEACNEV